MKLGYALGGGGARGSAHIGVLMELEQLGLKPDLVVGTSVGALIATLLACGLQSAEIKHFFEQFGLSNLFSFPGRLPSLTTPNKFDQLLKERIGTPTFDQLQIPLAVVATNLVTRQEVVLDEGDVISALHASMAFPILLPPVEREGLTLVDGGLVNNVPFDVVRARGATHVIAVGLSNSAPYGTPQKHQPPGRLVDRMWHATKRRPTMQIITAVSDIITSRVVQSRLALSQPDVFLRPYLGTIGLLDFHALDEGIQSGREAVWEAQAELSLLQKKFNTP